MQNKPNPGAPGNKPNFYLPNAPAAIKYPADKITCETLKIMKIASFNVNSLRARLPIVLDFLADQSPDVLCLQETKVQDKDFPAEPFDEIGYNYVFKGQKSYNGVAILSRHTIKDTSFGLDDEPQDQPRLASVRIAGISIVNTYIPQGREPNSKMFDYKLQWFQRLKEYFSKRFEPTDPVIWLGDLNVAPSPMDVYDPDGLLGSVCFCPEVSAALDSVMDWGFVDVFRKHCPEPNHYTFWDYRLRGGVSRNTGWRLDHIMATKPLAYTSVTCWIDKTPRLADRPSDHTPIIAEFNFDEP
jgi:exodeoxyribonuclease-3